MPCKVATNQSAYNRTGRDRIDCLRSHFLGWQCCLAALWMGTRLPDSQSVITWGELGDRLNCVSVSYKKGCVHSVNQITSSVLVSTRSCTGIPALPANLHKKERKNPKPLKRDITKNNWANCAIFTTTTRYLHDPRAPHFVRCSV